MYVLKLGKKGDLFIKLYDYVYNRGNGAQCYYLSDSLDFSMNLSDTSSVAAINSEASSYSEETDSDIDISIQQYQFEPSTGTLDISSEESSKEDDGNDERLVNMD